MPNLFKRKDLFRLPRLGEAGRWIIYGVVIGVVSSLGAAGFFYLLEQGVHLGLDLPCDYQIFLLFPLSHKDFALRYLSYSSTALLMVVTILSIAILAIRSKSMRKRGQENPSKFPEAER